MAYRRKTRSSNRTYSRKRTSRSGYSRRKPVSSYSRRPKRRAVSRRAPARRAASGGTIRIVVEHTSPDQIARPELVPAKVPSAPRKAKH